MTKKAAQPHKLATSQLEGANLEARNENISAN